MDIQRIVVKVCFVLSAVAMSAAALLYFLPSKTDAERAEKLARSIAEAESNYAAANGKYYLFPPEDKQAVQELGLSASLLQDFVVEVDRNRNSNMVVRIFPKGSAIIASSVKPALYEYDLKNKSGQWSPTATEN